MAQDEKMRVTDGAIRTELSRARRDKGVHCNYLYCPDDVRLEISERYRHRADVLIRECGPGYQKKVLEGFEAEFEIQFAPTSPPRSPGEPPAPKDYDADVQRLSRLFLHSADVFDRCRVL